MKTIKLILLAGIVLMIGCQFAMAQDPGPDPGGDPDAPIDGGIALLVAAGAIYGARKIKNMNESKA